MKWSGKFIEEGVDIDRQITDTVDENHVYGLFSEFEGEDNSSASRFSLSTHPFMLRDNNNEHLPERRKRDSINKHGNLVEKRHNYALRIS